MFEADRYLETTRHASPSGRAPSQQPISHPASPSGIAPTGQPFPHCASSPEIAPTRQPSAHRISPPAIAKSPPRSIRAGLSDGSDHEETEFLPSVVDDSDYESSDTHASQVLQEVQEKNIIKVVPRDDFYYNSVISTETPQDHTVRAWDALGQDSIIIRLRVEQPSFEDEYEPEREEREAADSASPRSRRPLPSPSDPIVQALARALRSHQCSCARVHGVRTFEVC